MYTYSIYIIITIIYIHILCVYIYTVYIYMPTKLLLIYPHKPWCFPCVHMFCLTISTSKTNLSRRGLDSELSLLLQKLKCLAGSRGIAPWIKGVLRFNLCEYVYEYVYHFILSYHILSCRILSCRILSYLSVYLSEFVYLSIYPLICKYKLEIEGIKVFFLFPPVLQKSQLIR